MYLNFTLSHSLVFVQSPNVITLSLQQQFIQLCLSALEHMCVPILAISHIHFITIEHFCTCTVTTTKIDKFQGSADSVLKLLYFLIAQVE